jgi:chromosome segregation ATPase
MMKRYMRFSIPTQAAFCCFVLSSLFHTRDVEAKTDVDLKLAQLKENVSSSQANLEQYEQGLRVVLANLQATERALKTIGSQKQTLAKQNLNSSADVRAVEAAKLEVESHLRVERDMLDSEERQMEELRQALAKLEANRIKRQANIQTYEQRLKGVADDREGTDERLKSINQLSAALAEQEAKALSEKMRLNAKKAEYEEEIGKWRKQVRVSQRSVANFSRLKPQ